MKKCVLSVGFEKKNLKKRKETTRNHSLPLEQDLQHPRQAESGPCRPSSRSVEEVLPGAPWRADQHSRTPSAGERVRFAGERDAPRLARATCEAFPWRAPTAQHLRHSPMNLWKEPPLRRQPQMRSMRRTRTKMRKAPPPHVVYPWLPRDPSL
jgi:hypothetical protein